MSPKTLCTLLLLGGFFTTATATPITLPFRLVRNLMIVQATVNGQTGNFLFDTGQSGIVLNARYFTGRRTPGGDCGGFESIGGTSDDCRGAHVQLHLTPKLTVRDYAAVVDLQPIEIAKRLDLLGMLGLKVLKDYEIVLDYQRLEIQLHPLDRAGNRRQPANEPPPDATLAIRWLEHVPYVTARLQGQELRLGLDTGAELNLMSPSLYDELRHRIRPGRPKQVITPTGYIQPVPSGWVPAVRIGTLNLPAQETLFLPLDDLNRLSGPDLDGLLGQEFLQYFRTAFNFKKKELRLWQKEALILAALKSDRTH